MDHLIVNFTVKNLSVLIIFSTYQDYMKQTKNMNFFIILKKISKNYHLVMQILPIYF